MSKIVGGNPKKAEKKNFIAIHSTIEKRKFQVSDLSSYLNSQGKEVQRDPEEAERGSNKEQNLVESKAADQSSQGKCIL